MRWHLVGPAVAVVVAAVAGIGLSGRGAEDPAPTSTALRPEEVSSDAPMLSSLEDLAASADLIVRGEVVATERGRVFGDPGGGAIESRLVTLRVDEALVGTPPSASLLLEEEGWLEDGRPLVVDGLAGSAVGDAGIWFLTRVGAGDAPRYVVVSAQGRYLVDDEDHLTGARLADPLVAELTALRVDELTARIRALPPGGG